MSDPKIISKAFKTEYNNIVRALRTKVILFAVSAPPPNKTLVVNAIWDTGATDSVITPNIAQQLSLFGVDTVNIAGVNSEGVAPVSLVHIGLPNSVLVPSSRVTIAKIGGGADMLIGMDIISRGDFLICNADGKTTFSFVMPPFPDKPDWVERSNKINQSDTEQ